MTLAAPFHTAERMASHAKAPPPMITTSPAVDESLMSSETEGWLPDFAFIFLAGGCLANQVAECCVEVWAASDAAASAASAVPTVASATPFIHERRYLLKG